MPRFNSYEDLAKYLNQSEAGKGNIFTVPISDDEGSVKKVLEEEAKRLEQLIKEEIVHYYNSYKPVRYKRTFNWLNSLRVDKPNIEGNKASIRIYFDDNLAYHPSVVSSDQPKGYVPWLMESGWQVKKMKKVIYRFTYFEGTHYIKNAIEKWQQTNQYGLKIAVYFNGEPYIIEQKE